VAYYFIYCTRHSDEGGEGGAKNLLMLHVGSSQTLLPFLLFIVGSRREGRRNCPGGDSIRYWRIPRLTASRPSPGRAPCYVGFGYLFVDKTRASALFSRQGFTVDRVRREQIAKEKNSKL